MMKMPPADAKKYPNDRRRLARFATSDDNARMYIFDAFSTSACVEELSPTDAAALYPATHRITLVQPRAYTIAEAHHFECDALLWRVVTTADPAVRRHRELWGSRAARVPVADAGKFVELYVRRIREED